jgi:abhydrolase domain-containing protein 17
MGSITSSLIFHPPQRNLSKYINIKYLKTLYNEDISYVEFNSKQKQVLIFSHGNACDISDNYYFLKDLSLKLNVCVVMYDYIGYGMSEKCPYNYTFSSRSINEETCYRSHETIVNHYKTLNKEIYLVGQSLGTGVVVDYISKHNTNFIKGVMLISPYKSICSILSDTILLYPIDQFISINKFNSIDKSLKIDIYHGKSDDIIDYKHSIILSKLCNSRLTLLDNVGHNDIIDYIDFINFLTF